MAVRYASPLLTHFLCLVVFSPYAPLWSPTKIATVEAQSSQTLRRSSQSQIAHSHIAQLQQAHEVESLQAVMLSLHMPLAVCLSTATLFLVEE